MSGGNARRVEDGLMVKVSVMPVTMPVAAPAGLPSTHTGMGADGSDVGSAEWILWA